MSEGRKNMRYINHGSFGVVGVNRVCLLQSKATGVFCVDYREREGGRRRRVNLKTTDLADAKIKIAKLIQELAAKKAPTATMALKHVLYVIQRGEDGPIKIGISTNLPARVKGLQTGSAEKIRVLRAYTMRDVEKAIHAELEKTERLNGEWFPAELLRVVDKFFNEDLSVKISRSRRELEENRRAAELLERSGLAGRI